MPVSGGLFSPGTASIGTRLTGTSQAGLTGFSWRACTVTYRAFLLAVRRVRKLRKSLGIGAHFPLEVTVAVEVETHEGIGAEPVRVFFDQYLLVATIAQGSGLRLG